MAKHTVIIKRPGEDLETVEFEGQYRCDLKKLVSDDDGIILDYVMLGQVGGRCFAMACDQDGIPKELPRNFHLITQSGGHKFLSNIVGTAVFFCYQWEDVWEKEIWDFELLDIDQSHIDITKDLLSEQRQQIILAASFKDMSIHHNEVIVTSFHPVLLKHLSFYFAVFGFNGMSMKFCTQPDCTDEHEINVMRTKGNNEVIVCSSATTAHDIRLPVPSVLDASQAKVEKAFSERLAKVKVLRESMTAIGIPDVVYVTNGEVDVMMHEVVTFDSLCHQSREGYETYITVMYDFDRPTQDKIRDILRIAVNLYSPSKKRKYIEEHLCGLLTPEEIAKIPIEKWR